MTQAGARRLLHAATAAVALLGLVSLSALRLATTYLAMTVVLVEALRLRIPAVGRGLAAHAPVYRDHERERPSGAMWLALGYAERTPATLKLWMMSWQSPSSISRRPRDRR